MKCPVHWQQGMARPGALDCSFGGQWASPKMGVQIPPGLIDSHLGSKVSLQVELGPFIRIVPTSSSSLQRTIQNSYLALREGTAGSPPEWLHLLCRISGCLCNPGWVEVLKIFCFVFLSPSPSSSAVTAAFLLFSIFNFLLLHYHSSLWLLACLVTIFHKEEGLCGCDCLHFQLSLDR